MIDRVNNSYTNSYLNNGTKTRNIGKSEDVPEFLLDYDTRGVVWDRDDKKQKQVPNLQKETKKPELKDTYERSQDYTKPEPVKTEASASSGIGILDGIKKLFKRIFDFIWYGDQKPEETADKEKADISIPAEEKLNQASKTKDYTGLDENEKDSLIRKLISRHDTDAVVDVLTDGGKNMPARCTSLVTYYDRQGNLVSDNSVMRHEHDMKF